MKLSVLLQSVTTLTAKEADGIRWYPVRPKTAENTFIRLRIKAAWRVLTGQSDAVEWDFPKTIANPRTIAKAERDTAR